MKEQSGDRQKYPIGDKIKKYREDCGISQRELADTLGVSNTRVSNWEQGINRPDADMIGGICRALNVSPSHLLDVRLTDDDLTDRERAVVQAYRQRPEMQHAVDVLLGLTSED